MSRSDVAVIREDEGSAVPTALFQRRSLKVLVEVIVLVRDD